MDTFEGVRDGDERVARALAGGQGAFYLATGVWPLVHRRSFEAVTGRKKEPWLVETVGVLVAAIGGALLAARRRGPVRGELRLLAGAAAAGIAAIELWYAGPRRRIAPVYLADAVGEAALAGAWAALAARRSARGREAVGEGASARGT